MNGSAKPNTSYTAYPTPYARHDSGGEPVVELVHELRRGLALHPPQVVPCQSECSEHSHLLIRVPDHPSRVVPCPPEISYLTKSVSKVVSQKSTPPQIRQLILHYD